MCANAVQIVQKDLLCVSVPEFFIQFRNHNILPTFIQLVSWFLNCLLAFFSKLPNGNLRLCEIRRGNGNLSSSCLELGDRRCITLSTILLAFSFHGFSPNFMLKINSDFLSPWTVAYHVELDIGCNTLLILRSTLAFEAGSFSCIVSFFWSRSFPVH